MTSMRKLLVFGFSIMLTAFSPTWADSFIDTGDNSSFNRDAADFSNSLDSAGSRMRADYDNSNLSASHRYLTNMNANQDTMNASQQAFNNTQTQMVLSGGAYNNQGFVWGMGAGSLFGGGGYGSSSTGGSSMNMSNFSGTRPFYAQRYRGKYMQGSYGD